MPPSVALTDINGESVCAGVDGAIDWVFI